MRRHVFTHPLHEPYAQSEANHGDRYPFTKLRLCRFRRLGSFARLGREEFSLRSECGQSVTVKETSRTVRRIQSVRSRDQKNRNGKKRKTSTASRHDTESGKEPTNSSRSCISPSHTESIRRSATEQL